MKVRVDDHFFMSSWRPRLFAPLGLIAVFLFVSSVILCASRKPQDPGALLSFGITGNVQITTPPNLNPSHMLNQTALQRMLLTTAGKPQKKEIIERVCQECGIPFENLEKMGLIRKKGRYLTVLEVLPTLR